MNKCVFLIIFSCSVNGVFSQKLSSGSDKKMRNIASTEQDIKLIRRERSISKIKEINEITAGKNNVYISGYITSFAEDKAVENSILWKISENGISVKKLPFPGRIDEIFFADDNTGWILVKGGDVYKTVDGGDSWDTFEFSDDVKSSPFFINDSLGWFWGKDDHLKMLNNGELNSLKLLEETLHIKKIYFASVQSGWLIDVVNSRNRFLHTEDGGETWQPVKIDDGNIDDFQFLNEREGFAIGPKGLYFTTDSGNNWQFIKEQNKDEWINKLFFLDKLTGWVSGKNICSTTDGGKEWKCVDFPKTIQETIKKRIIFTDKFNGWLLTERGIYSTQDSGRTWNKEQLYFVGENF